MIDINSLYHQPLSNYAFSLSENALVFRLRTRKDDIEKVYFNFGDTAFRGNPVEFERCKMNIFMSDEYFDYYEIVIKDSYKRLVYYFELHKDQEIKFYYGDIVYDTVSPERNDLFKLPYHRKEDILDVPSWLKEATIYNIFPDSFASSKNAITGESKILDYKGFEVKSKLGGTIKGIEENLDYIKDLGFDTVYLNPIFTAGEYHKYDLIDYYSIDPCFGTNEDFKSLVDSCHEKDMRIIIDGVFNHCGWNFFAFLDVVENGEDSKYKDWFYALQFPVIKPDTFETIPNYECFGYERLMPKLNTSNKDVINYFMDVTTYWTKEFGIDGWRLDVADEVDVEFWRLFRKTVKNINKEVVIIGEVWQSAKYFLDGSMFDSTMNYSLLKHSKDFFAKRAISSEQFNTRITSLLTRYHKNINYGQLNLLDSHDVPRFLSHCDNDIHKYKLALLFLFTFVGAPMMFYGDEVGFTGIKEKDYRQKMKFTTHDLVDFTKKITRLRRRYNSLKTGDYETILTNRKNGIFGYKRFNDEEEITIYLNVSDEQFNLPEDVLKHTNLLTENVHGNSMDANSYIVLLNK